MKLTRPAPILAGLGLAAAGTLPVKRWDYDVCLKDCSLAGVAMPDQDTFQLPLEGFWSEQCPLISIGSANSPRATSRVCMSFAGTALHFAFAPFSGFNIKSAVVTWKVKGNIANSGDWTSPPPTAKLTCAPSSGGGYACELPFNEMLHAPHATSIAGLLAGMCPNGDREALGLYLAFSGTAEPVGGGAALTFQQQPPCKTRASDRSCTAWASSPTSHIEVSYRCTKCNVNPCPSSCTCGTAFGYQHPDNDLQKSFTLDTQPGKGCDRWGWFSTPTLAELQSAQGVSGPLYVGASGNDIGKAVSVGSWLAKADARGGVTLSYQLTPPYVLAGAHADLKCLPIDTCAECTYSSGPLANQGGWSNREAFVYPTCEGGAKVALVVHADVNTMTGSTTCPPPVNTI